MLDMAVSFIDCVGVFPAANFICSVLLSDLNRCNRIDRRSSSPANPIRRSPVESGEVHQL